MTYRLRYHPAVVDDLRMIAEMISDYAGPQVARRKLDEIARVAQGLQSLPHIGTRRDHVLPGLRAIPAARRAVIAFTIDEDAQEIHVLTITYAGADWITRLETRRQ
ncbi:type II toxin-antitoxin system RelE/ParE family toxin [Ruegeria sp. Ofav3-42]|uniref:type II toxin-antitoxin system RelE/ParE family toxin n=1 Tax=Ruegeria sp. Ofav3-42 TaxID=2917759 RepID=UPI001EF65FBD|nr:type II toxin-antitoxin system RelE/ParE family toxin [Ruegeria sp. Ofav3-42]MCG7521808.1 type II toxin-antitoxin system RelE/ParE family toxin [Ruegeria sp. Ofav3-42]